MKLFINILWMFFLIVQAYNMNAQCNEKLVIEAASKSGSNAVFMRDFRVHLAEGNIKNPVPYKKISVFLNKQVLYRFTVADSKEYSGRMLLQLYNKGELLGSTFEFENNNHVESFNFLCSRSGMYQVLLSFIDGKEGCGVGVMSMVMNDSLSVIDPSFKKLDNKGNIMYLGLDNELRIASDSIGNGRVEVTISQGIISGNGGVYVAKPEKTGKVSIYVKIFDATGILKTNDTIDFLVINAPLPDAALLGKTGGFISKSKFGNIQSLTLIQENIENPMTYEIVGFSLQKSKFDVNSLTSCSARFSNRQIQFLQNLQSGDTFIITHILVKGADNKVYELNPLGFIVD